MKSRTQQDTSISFSYQAIDALSKLIVLLVRYHTDPAGVNNNKAKVSFLTKILSVMVLVLVHTHNTQGVQFNQKPFVRLFLSLLNDFFLYETQLQSVYFDILATLR